MNSPDFYSSSGSSRQPRRVLTLRGETKGLAEWGRLLGIGVETLMMRLRAGWSDEDVLLRPVKKIRGSKGRRRAREPRVESVGSAWSSWCDLLLEELGPLTDAWQPVLSPADLPVIAEEVRPLVWESKVVPVRRAQKRSSGWDLVRKKTVRGSKTLVPSEEYPEGTKDFNAVVRWLRGEGE